MSDNIAVVDDRDGRVNDPDRRLATLTKEDRRFLLGDESGYNRRDKSDRKHSIIPRSRHSLTDLRLNAEQIRPEWLDEIFGAEPRTHEYDELLRDVEGTVAFLYAGLGGEQGFRKPLVRGVSRGEKMLGHVDYKFQVEPRFAVDIASPDDHKEVVQAIKRGEWDRLDRNSIFSFIESAARLGAIDFEAIEEHLDKSPEEQMESWAESSGYSVESNDENE